MFEIKESTPFEPIIEAGINLIFKILTIISIPLIVWLIVFFLVSLLFTVDKKIKSLIASIIAIIAFSITLFSISHEKPKEDNFFNQNYQKSPF